MSKALLNIQLKPSKESTLGWFSPSVFSMPKEVRPVQVGLGKPSAPPFETFTMGVMNSFLQKRKRTSNGGRPSTIFTNKRSLLYLPTYSSCISLHISKWQLLIYIDDIPNPQKKNHLFCCRSDRKPSILKSEGHQCWIMLINKPCAARCCLCLRWIFDELQILTQSS